MRMTRQHILDDFKQLGTYTGLNLEIEWSGSPIKPRIFRTSESGDVGTLSPRLIISELHLWMEAFTDGFAEGFYDGRARP